MGIVKTVAQVRDFDRSQRRRSQWRNFQADFSNKISIAYKESLETKYWLSLLKDSNYISSAAFESMFQDADELSRILYAILKKTRNGK